MENISAGYKKYENRRNIEDYDDKCYNMNYIPHKECRNDFNTWFNYYFDELSVMYQILIDNVQKMDNKKRFKWFLQIEAFHEFCKIVYDSSSKYIDI